MPKNAIAVGMLAFDAKVNFTVKQQKYNSKKVVQATVNFLMFLSVWPNEKLLVANLISSFDHSCC